MRKSAQLVQLLILIFILFGPAFASATLSTKVQRGEKLVQIPVAGRNAEICIVLDTSAMRRIQITISRTRPSCAASINTPMPPSVLRSTAQILGLISSRYRKAQLLHR